MSEDVQPKVIRSWLRFDDVVCVRHGGWAGPEGELCFVVEDGVVCDECITHDEQARAVPQK